MSLERAEKAVAHDSSDVQAMSSAASALAALGESEQARAWIARALRVDPDHRAMRYNLACSLIADLDDAEVALELLGPYLATATRSELGHAEADPDLDGLRADPRYQALLADADARLAAGGAGPP